MICLYLIEKGEKESRCTKALMIEYAMFDLTFLAVLFQIHLLKPEDPFCQRVCFILKKKNVFVLLSKVKEVREQKL